MAVELKTLLGYLRRMGAMFLENSSGRKLSQFMTHHILRHEDRVEDLSVMNKERMPNELRRDRRTAGPRPNCFLDARVIHLINLVEEMLINERTFF